MIRYGTSPTSNAFHVSGQLGVRRAGRTDACSVTRCSRDTSTCYGPDQRERRLRASARPPRPADPDRPTGASRRHIPQSGRFSSARSAGSGATLSRTFSNVPRLTANGNKCTRSLAARARCAQLFGGDKDQIGRSEQRLFARGDLARLRRARRQVVDAVIDRQRRIERGNHVAGQRRRQERPHHRPRRADRRHPAVDARASASTG